MAAWPCADPLPPTLGPPIARDDDHTAAFWLGGGMLAWTRDRGIDLAFLESAPT